MAIATARLDNALGTVLCLKRIPTSVTCWITTRPVKVWVRSLMSTTLLKRVLML